MGIKNKKIAVLGTGGQGTAVVRRLLDGGHCVHAHDCNPAQMRAARDLGATVHMVAAQAIALADVILLVLPANDAAIDVMGADAALAALRPGTVVLQMGSSAVATSQYLEHKLNAHGGHFAECILGGPITTILEGKCPLFFGGCDAAFEVAQEVCAVIGPLMRIGRVGQATAFNLAGLTALYSLLHGFGLACAMAERSGIDMGQWRDFVRDGILGHPGQLLADFFWPAHFKPRNYTSFGPVQFGTEGALMETRLLTEFAKQMQVDTSLIEVLQSKHQGAFDMLPDGDWSAVYDVLAPLAKNTPTAFDSNLPEPRTAMELLAEAAQRQADPDHIDEGYLSEAHGFLPATPPDSSLPASHQAWSQIADELPQWIATGRLRHAIRELPLLRADENALEARYVIRAASIIGILAHAYVREDEYFRAPQTGQDALARHDDPERLYGGLPYVIEAPWRELTRRLGRSEPCLSLNDLVLSNWRLRDTPSPGPLLVEDLALCTPILGIEEERIFYMTVLETVSVTTPLLGAMARIEIAVQQNDNAAIKRQLRIILECIGVMTNTTLPKIAPASGHPLHVDPACWARLVAPFGAPIRKGEPGLSGAASPVVHLLDAFFKRGSGDSKMGREVSHLLQWLPATQRRFIQRVSQIGMDTIAAKTDDAELRDLYQNALRLYAGREGWLGQHRRKVYGFMEVGFRAQRTSTNGGFSGTACRAWERLDDDLENARHERIETCPAHTPVAATRPAQTEQEARFSMADVATHNTAEAGYWLALHGDVFDVSNYLDRHPGGAQILRLNAGMDATRSFERADHANTPKITALLKHYRIGRLQQPDFTGDERQAPLATVYQAWVDHLHRIVEQENIARNTDWITKRPTVVGDDAGSCHLLRARLRLDQCAAFCNVHIVSIIGNAWTALWHQTVELCAPHIATPIDRNPPAVAENSTSASLYIGLRRLHDMLQPDASAHNGPESRARIDTAWACIGRLDAVRLRLCTDLKLLLQDGIRIFEQMDSGDSAAHAEGLVALLTRMSECISLYFLHSSQKVMEMKSELGEHGMGAAVIVETARQCPVVH